MKIDHQNKLYKFYIHLYFYNSGKKIYLIINHLVNFFLYIASRPKVKKIKSDILFLHSNENISHGKKQLINQLKKINSIKINEYFFLSWPMVLKNKHLCNTDYKVLNIFKIRAFFAKYIVSKYYPKIIITSTEDVIASFLKYELSSVGSTLINFSHSISFLSPNFSMNDYHYNFIYGKKSFQNLKGNLRFGSSNIIQLPLIDNNEIGHKKKIKSNNNIIIFFSSWKPSFLKKKLKNLDQYILNLAQNFCEFKFIIKLHPLEDGTFWHKKEKIFKNIYVESSYEKIIKLIKISSLCICPSHSSTPLDAVLFNSKPIIVDCDKIGRDFYQSYPELKKKTDESLLQILTRVNEDHKYKNDLKKFYQENVNLKKNNIATIANEIQNILKNKKIKYNFLNSNFRG